MDASSVVLRSFICDHPFDQLINACSLQSRQDRRPMEIDRLGGAVLPECRELPRIYRRRVREDFFQGRKECDQGFEREVKYRRLLSAVTPVNPLQELLAGDLFRAA